MILALNVGNTNVTLGYKINGGIIKTVRRRSTEFKTSADFYGFIDGEISGNVEGAVISSVNPRLTGNLCAAVNELFGISPLIVSAALDMEVDLSLYDTSLIGSDRIAVCEAAVNEYELPAVVFDFGTATTVNMIDCEGKFLGGAILPGIMMGVTALAAGTAQLPAIKFESEIPLIGKNTRECINAGAIYGNAAMLDGMIWRIQRSINHKLTVIITGGGGEYIAPLCGNEIIYAPELLMDGLFFLYDRNITDLLQNVKIVAE